MWEHGILDVSLKGSGNLSAKQYYAVIHSSDLLVVIATANADVCGILQNQPTTGEEAVIRVLGMSLHIANEVINRMTQVTSTSAGKGEEVDAASEFYYGLAYTASGAQNDLFTLMLSFGVSHASDA